MGHSTFSLSINALLEIEGSVMLLNVLLFLTIVKLAFTISSSPRPSGSMAPPLSSTRTSLSTSISRSGMPSSTSYHTSTTSRRPIFGMSPPVELAPLTTPAVFGGGWSIFRFNHRVGKYSDLAYSFNETRSVLVRIADLSCSGDQFEVIVDGVSLGNTSNPIFDNCQTFTADPNTAYFTHRGWSRGTYVFQPGPHNLWIKTFSAPNGDGVGVIRFDYNMYYDDADSGSQ